MTHKKKILIISISIGLAVALAVTFITLAFTVWKPKVKTTQEWLNDFKDCLVLSKDDGEQKTKRSIIIIEGGQTILEEYYLENLKENDYIYFEVITDRSDSFVSNNAIGLYSVKDSKVNKVNKNIYQSVFEFSKGLI